MGALSPAVTGTVAMSTPRINRTPTDFGTVLGLLLLDIFLATYLKSTKTLHTPRRHFQLHRLQAHGLRSSSCMALDVPLRDM